MCKAPNYIAKGTSSRNYIFREPWHLRRKVCPLLLGDLAPAEGGAGAAGGEDEEEEEGDVAVEL